MPPNTIGRIILVSFAIIVISSFILGQLGGFLPIGLTSVFYKIGTSWFFIFIYFVMFNLFKDGIGLFVRFVNFIPNDAITRYTKENWMGFAFMVGFVALLMVCGYLKYQWKVRVEQPVYVEKNIIKSENDSIVATDSLFVSDSLRIVAISDLHLGYNIDEKELLKWIDLINKENPDVVLIAGDIIDNSLKPINAGYFAECFGKIKSKYGIYACLGNHEYISGVKESLGFYEEAGIHLLRDSAVLVDNCFYVVGRDDRSNEKRKPLEDIMANVDKSKPVILLDHQPYNLEVAEQNGVDLQISGHTHRGQIWPISLITDMMYEKSAGYLKKGDTNYVVSSGIGIWGGKFRIGTQSEYVVIEMKKK